MNLAILPGNLNQTVVREVAVANDLAKVNVVVVEGFRSDYDKNYRNAFDLEYYEFLCEETFQYRRVLPITYITHLKSKHVKLGTVVIGRVNSH